jgi:type IV pilus assembly protein PilW
VQWARRQAGTSLIEILIAMVIALFIMGGVVVVFVNMQKTFTSQDQLSQLQDNERLALTILTNTVQTAGYFPDPLHYTAVTALPASGVLATAQVISGTTGTGTGSNSDTLTVQFATASGDGNMNCLGQTNTSGKAQPQVFINTVSVSPNNELQCSLNGQAAVPLVSGVSGFQVLYGIDSGHNGTVDSYWTAAQVAAAQGGTGDWSSVHTVQVTLTFATQFGNLGGSTQNTQWTQMISLKNQP